MACEPPALMSGEPPSRRESVIENDDYWDYCYDDDDEPCEGCGRYPDDDGEPCPMCCGLSFAPGSEDCDFCGYYDECAEFMMKRA